MFILLYGPDTFRSRKRLKEMRREFIAKRDPSALNVVGFDVAKNNHEEVWADILAVPFLAEKRLIIIENLLSEKVKSALDNWLIFLKNNQTCNNVLIFWEGEIDKKPHSLFEFLKDQPYSQSFEILEGEKITSWLKREAKTLDADIDPLACQSLVKQADGDLWRLNNELARVVAFTKAKGKRIVSQSEVNVFLGKELDENVFHFVEALVNQRAAEAAKLLADLFSGGLTETEILGALNWQIKNLLVIKNYFELNKGGDAQTAAKQLDIHPFVLKKSTPLLSRFSFNKLKEIYQALLNFDIKIKTSQGSPALLLDLLIAKISA